MSPPMDWQRGVILLGVTLMLGGCGSAATSTATSTTARSTSSAPPSAVTAISPAATASRAPAPTPIPTLASTSEAASQAPAGAIPIQMITLPNAAPRFAPDHVAARAGTAVFFLTNLPRGPFAPDHNMLIGPAIGQVLARTPTFRPNEAMTFAVHDLMPGTFIFWCSIVDPGSPDHASEGMVGALTVTP